MIFTLPPTTFDIDSPNDYSGMPSPKQTQQSESFDNADITRSPDADHKRAEKEAVDALSKLSRLSRQIANGSVDTEGKPDNLARTIANAGAALERFSSRSVTQAGQTSDADLKEQIAQRVEDVMSAGIEVMHIFMNLISNQANGKFDEMRNKAKVSADAKEKSTVVDGILAGLVKPEDTAELSADVITYMRENNILVDGKTIDEYLDGKTALNKTQLTQIKGAIDNVANRAGDFVTQAQLELQKLMQLFSMLTNQISTLQTKKKDDIGTIIRGMG